MKSILKLKFKISMLTMVLMATLVSLFTSCDDILTEKPRNFYSTENFFENTQRMQMAVNGVYEVFSIQWTYGLYWMAYDCDTDIMHVNGSGLGMVTRDIGHYNIYVEHSWLEQTWQSYYQGIDRANTILENAAKVEARDDKDQQLKDRLIAETRALRAICYFDLVRLFGDVPLKTTASKAQDNFMMVRTDRDVIYDTIVADLQAAIPALQYTANQQGAYDGRINKGAVMGLLARVNMFRAGYYLAQDGQIKRPDNYQDYFQNAITITDTIIASGKHSLLSSYERVFRNMCELISDPTENMWEIPFFNATGDFTHTGMMGTYNGPFIDGNSIYGRANSFIKTHHLFYDLYENLDLRKDVAVATFRIDSKNAIIQYPRNQSYLWAPGKWRRNWHTGQMKNLNNTDVNVVLIRYADVLLMRAEAENEVNGVTSVAVEYLNKVRRRAFGFDYNTPEPSVDYAVVDFQDADAFRMEIVDERARELCFEGGRRQDLIRWNLLHDKITETGDKVKAALASNELRFFNFVAAELFTPQKHELYPIPMREIIETKGTLTQNPKYSN